jgi:hypothetical protein
MLFTKVRCGNLFRGMSKATKKLVRIDDISAGIRTQHNSESLPLDTPYSHVQLGTLTDVSVALQ